tara:strand:+ start:667 stop:942 length:276 start_codon:yes stop_codon:yes gene_type:complete
MRREELREIVSMMLDTMPGQISNKDISTIITTFIIYKKKANEWPIINKDIETGLVEYLVSQAIANDMNGEIIQDAVKDADDFLGRIVNDAG